MVGVDVLFAPEDTNLVQGLLDALAANGMDVHQAAEAAGYSTLVVLITPAMMGEGQREHAVTVAERYRDVLPVSFLPGAAPLFAHLSQSLVSQLGVDEVARRIATIARYGGQAIVDWNNLVSRTMKWKAEGQQALLAESDVPAALTLMQSPPAQSSNRHSDVAEFVSASQAAVNRRRRIGTGVVAATAVVLAVVLVFAAIQAVSARRAQVRAEDAGKVATANRLARSAIDLIPGNPDLPRLLVDRALASAVTPASQEAAARVNAGTWPHESYQLDFLPFGVSAAAQSTRIAVTDSTREEIVVFERPGGARMGSFQFGSSPEAEGGKGRLSPDGRRLATKSNTAGLVRLFDVDSGEPSGPLRWSRSNDVLLDWLDIDHVLLGRGNQVLAVDPDSGDSSVIAELGAGEEIDSGSMSPNREHFIVATGESTVVIDVAGKRIEHTVAGGMSSPAVANDGTFAVGSGWPYTVSVSMSGEGEPAARRVAIPPNAAVALDGPYMLVTSTEGDMFILANGVDRPIQTVRAHLSDRVRATRLNDGRIATVGTDGYLRVWEVPKSDVLGLPTSLGFVTDAVSAGSIAGIELAPRESARDQIRMTASDSIAVTLPPGAARVVSTPDMKTSQRYFFTGLYADVFLSRDGTHIASVSKEKIQTFRYSPEEKFWNDDDTRVMVGDHIDMAYTTGGKGVGAVSDDGSTVTLADEYNVTTHRVNAFENREASFLEPRRPVALYADPDGSGYALTADGYLRSSDGTEHQIAFPDSEGEGATVVAAADVVSADDRTIITPNGTIYGSSAGRFEAIGSVGAGTDTFALRTSSDGNLVAAVGETGMVIFDKGAHTVVYRQASHGMAMVTDVAFTDDAKVLYAINKIGGVSRIDIGKGPRADEGSPRELTGQELSLFELSGD